MSYCRLEAKTNVRVFLQKITIVVLLAVLVSGCGDYRAINDDNVEFRRAEKARTEDKMDLAIKHYLECLRLAPGSYKAHLQLALIYEDHKGDMPLAIVHYQAYLKTAPAEDLTQVQRLLEGAQEKYYRELTPKFGIASVPQPSPELPAVVVSLPSPQPPRPEPEEPTPTTTATTAPPPQEPAPQPPPKPKVYVVKSGDTLTRISKKLYGTTRHADAIFKANRHQLSSPDRVQIGQTLTLPAIEEVNTTAP